MKRPRRASEVALIVLPIIGVGAFAWYQRRIEQVKPPPKPPFSSVDSCGMTMRRASTQLRARGISHEIKVMIKYSGQRPLWWGSWTKVATVAPLLDVNQQKMPPGFKRQQDLAYGAVLTTTSMQKGKPVIKIQWRDNGVGLAGIDIVNNQLVLSHEMALNKIPLNSGDVTFRGLYLVPGGQPIRIQCVIRPAIKPLVIPKNKPTPPTRRGIMNGAVSHSKKLS